MIGKTLSHFHVTAKLGEGGMGEVYRAQDMKLGREVAIKVLPETVAGDPERLARFEREAQVVAALNHPNIVTVHSIESVEVSGRQVHFIAMELVEGQTLSELLPRDGFPSGRLLEIAIPLADAVSCAHRAGITHRDLKPDNVMIDNEGRLRVLDFGLAKPKEPLSFGESTQAATATAVTEEGKILGTVAYMAPEQAEGKPVDSRSDVFSLGTILYEMASGRRPFQGDTSMSTIGSILKDEPVSVTELNHSLPRHLGRIVRRCLAKDPDRRYQSALDLRNELEELKAEIDSGGYVSEPHSASLRSSRSSRPLLLLGAVAALAIVALVAVTSWRGSVPPPPVYDSRPITSAIGQEMDVNWSPESEFIAFAQHREGNIDVVVQPVAGGDAVVRAGGPGDETTPRWSPDGKYLAYVSSLEPGSFIYLVSPHGGSPRKLIETNIPMLDIDTASSSMGDRPWAMNGKTLLISRVDDSGQIAIYRVDRDNGEAEQLTFPLSGSADVSASYSFDGKQIVFARTAGVHSALMTMPAAGGDPQVLLADEFDNQKPAWRPDNRHVVFLSNRGGGGNTDVWELDGLVCAQDGRNRRAG
ncbi:MAG: protein kinase [Bacteroidia bacterium]|nr:protein kinase [Bacteroidia bacterium]